VGRTIGIKLRYDDFRAVTRDQTIAEPTQDAATIRRVAGLCLKRVPLDGVCACWGARGIPGAGGAAQRRQHAAGAGAMFRPGSFLTIRVIVNFVSANRCTMVRTVSVRNLSAGLIYARQPSRHQ
jgi:hypothetical protein